MFTVTIDTDAFTAECDALLDAIERASYAALDETARALADKARSSHWYRNRTGDLERSTQAIDAEGDLWSGSASSGVVASELYASFVDARSPILSPAWDAIALSAEARFETTIAQACR